MAWAPDYVTAEELAAYVRILDDNDDVQIGLAIAGASRAIDRTCKRQFGLVSAPVARIYSAHLDPRLLRMVVDIDDLQTAVGLEVGLDLDGSGGFASVWTQFVPGPVNAVADGLPWTRLQASAVATQVPALARETVRVTARFGWTTVPDTVKEACLLQASRLLKRRDAPFGVAGSPETGSELRLLAKVDPDVAVLLRPYTRRWYAA